jgi:hypothetical protein
MKCVVSQQLVRVTVTLILPVAQEFLVTRKALECDWQSAEINNCDRLMREHCSGCSAGFCRAERKSARMRA